MNTQPRGNSHGAGTIPTREQVDKQHRSTYFLTWLQLPLAVWFTAGLLISLSQTVSMENVSMNRAWVPKELLIG